MTIQPVASAPEPGYPDKYTAGRRVLSAKPRRWAGAPLATGVLAAAVALGLSGCGDILSPGGAPGIVPESVETTPGVTPTLPEYVIMGTEAPIMDPDDFVTAGEPVPFQFGNIPLFAFGEGTGAIGCVAISAPVFLSEDEAFAILSAAFEQTGLTLDKDAETLYAVNRPVTDLYGLGSSENADTQILCESLDSDGALAVGNARLPMFFVSQGDMDAWQKETNMMSSVSSYHIKDAAQTLAENNTDLLVFYDPLVTWNVSDNIRVEPEEGESEEAYSARWDEAWRKAEQSARAQSEQLLRSQAEAFLQWLRAEGII